MLIGFRVTESASATIWDPKSKGVYSPTCRHSCCPCKILVKIVTIVLRLYVAHRNKNHAR